MTKNDKTAGLNSVDEENAALFKVCPFRCMETPPSFSTIFFQKGDNFCDFLFAYQEDKVFPKWGLLFKEKICSNCSSWSKFFLLRDDPKFMGTATMKMTELLPMKMSFG